MTTNYKNNFSVGLGLFDYINPIFYFITSLTIILNINKIFDTPFNIIFIIGAIISIVFGLAIPTIKLLVGLGKMKFEMPVNLVFFVNSGIVISDTALIKEVFNLNVVTYLAILLFIIGLLLLIYLIKKKFNTVAVLTGVFGYLLMYISFIYLAIQNNAIISLILYALAIVLMIVLCLMGIKSDLNNAKVHWGIEITNVLCQGFVALSTVILFTNL